MQEGTTLVHRILYEVKHGPVPEGLECDHLCRVRHCVNPDHIEPVTKRENQRRGEGIVGKQIRQTHCIRGHLLEGENIRTYGRTVRDCVLCMKVYREENKERLRKNMREYYHRKKAEKALRS